MATKYQSSARLATHTLACAVVLSQFEDTSIGDG